MTHTRAVLLMVVVALMWSIAGVVSRHLEAARSFEVTFWRSLFTAAALLAALLALRGVALWRSIVGAGWPLWFSSLCWAVMYTNFMLAITLTKVATVLITLAIAPLVTALFARLFLRHRQAPRTWAAMGVAGAGIAWMFARDALEGGPGSLLGIAVALGVPLAAAANWTLLQYIHLHPRAEADEPEMLPAVFLGALISAAVTLPMALPFAASAHDLGLLGLLGVVQLAIPCLLVVQLARILPAPEISLLALLEVVFGVAWAWMGAGEVPGTHTWAGGALVLTALLINEGLALRERTLAAA